MITQPPSQHPDPLAQLLDEMITYCEGLLSRFNLSEPHFLKIADLLEGVATEISATHQNCQRLVAAESGQQNGNNVVLDSIALIRQALDDAENLNGNILSTIQNLKTMDGLAEAVLKNEPRLKAAIAPFTIVRMLFKIHSAPLSEEHRLVFATLSEELEKLDQGVRKVFLEQFKNLYHVRVSLGNALPELDRKTTLVQSQLHQQQKEMAGALGLLDQKIAESKGTALVLDQQSTELNRQFSRLIMGTQFHDIVRQRLEHIVSAVRKMKLTYDSFTLSSSHEEKGSLGHYLSAALQIQGKQIEALLARLTEAEQTIRSGVEGLVSTAGKVAEESLRFHDQTAQGSSIDAVIHALISLFDSLSKKLAISRHSSHEGYQAVLPLKEMVSDLTGTLSSISIDIRLIALNSQVKAAQINEGTGLDVLSSKTREIANTILELNGLLARDLGSLSSVFAESFLALDETTTKIDSSSRDFAATAQTSSHSLQSLLASIGPLISPITASHQKVGQTGKEILHELQFRDKLSTDITKLPDLLGRFKPMLHALTNDCRPTEQSQKSLNELRKLYTMEAEHTIHDSVTGPKPEEDSAFRPAAEDVSFDLDDFGLLAAPQTSAPSSETSKEDLGSNIEMF